jgi:hypothetical protein
MDPALRRYAESQGSAEEEAPEQVLVLHAAPVIDAVLRRRLGYIPKAGPFESAAQADWSEARGDAILLILQTLRHGKADGTLDRMRDLRAYSATVAHRAFGAMIRKRFPQRRRFAAALHGILVPANGFAQWDSDADDKLAGFVAWIGRAPVREGRRLEAAIRDPQAVVPGLHGRRELGARVAAIFDYLGGPVALDVLIGIVLKASGVEEFRAGTAEDALENVAAREPSVNVQAETRSFLTFLWREVMELPVRQRAALLLNLRDHAGRGVIALFPIAGVATLRELAAALELEWDAFATVWKGLPLEDAAIAELLGITRQQVINLRKAARDRLKRREAEYGQE